MLRSKGQTFYMFGSEDIGIYLQVYDVPNGTLVLNPVKLPPGVESFIPTEIALTGISEAVGRIQGKSVKEKGVMSIDKIIQDYDVPLFGVSEKDHKNLFGITLSFFTEERVESLKKNIISSYDSFEITLSTNY